MEQSRRDCADMRSCFDAGCDFIYRKEAGEYLALRPLDREIDETWQRFAIAAADEGVSPDVLAEHIHEQGGRVVTGPYSSRYLELIPQGILL